MKINFNKFLFKHRSKINKSYHTKNNIDALNAEVHYIISFEYYFLKEKGAITSWKSRAIEKRDDLYLNEELEKILDKVFDDG